MKSNRTASIAVRDYPLAAIEQSTGRTWPVGIIVGTNIGVALTTMERSNHGSNGSREPSLTMPPRANHFPRLMSVRYSAGGWIRGGAKMNLGRGVTVHSFVKAGRKAARGGEEVPNNFGGLGARSKQQGARREPSNSSHRRSSIRSPSFNFLERGNVCVLKRLAQMHRTPIRLYRLKGSATELVIPHTPTFRAPCRRANIHFGGLGQLAAWRDAVPHAASTVRFLG